jgi:IQ and AAA domain-containing protein
LHDVVAEEEGPSIREKLLAERRAWFTEEIGKGAFPDSMQAYYDFLKGPDPEEAAEAKDDGKGKKGKKDAKDKKKEKKGDKKGKKVGGLPRSAVRFGLSVLLFLTKL